MCLEFSTDKLGVSSAFLARLKLACLNVLHRLRVHADGAGEEDKVADAHRLAVTHYN